MNCPFCGSEMQEKYIESSSRMYLVNGLHPIFGPIIERGKLCLTGFGATGIAAHYCPKCKKAVCDIEQI